MAAFVCLFARSYAQNGASAPEFPKNGESLQSKLYKVYGA